MSQVLSLQQKARQDIISWLLKEKIAAGSKIPADAIFARKLGVSTMTLANALKELENEGIVKRIPRRGTYLVNQLKMPKLVDVYCPSQWREVLLKHDYMHHSFMLYRQYIDGIMNACIDFGLIKVHVLI